jgi:hypothetical protein
VDLEVFLQVVTDVDFFLWVVLPAILIALVVRPTRGGRQIASLGDVAKAVGGTTRGGARSGDGAVVDGRLDGRPVDLRIAAEPGLYLHLRILYTVGLLEPHRELVVTRLEGAASLVIQAVDGSRGPHLSVRARAIVTELLAPGDRLTIRRDRMTLERSESEPQRAATLLGTLCHLAGAAVALDATPHVDLVLGRESAAHCPWCRDALEPAAPDAVACAVCATRHHDDCFELAHGCTVFGCGGGPARRIARATI